MVQLEFIYQSVSFWNTGKSYIYYLCSLILATKELHSPREGETHIILQ